MTGKTPAANADCDDPVCSRKNEMFDAMRASVGGSASTTTEPLDVDELGRASWGLVCATKRNETKRARERLDDDARLTKPSSCSRRFTQLHTIAAYYPVRVDDADGRSRMRECILWRA